ncbi:flagellin [Selenomonas sp. GACV-9]|uniref:flagellin N-terminal helical domain-containing protein n=1 Tax=Selenomonas sp. GACV-9 TaxID=3158782 RepID=UPI0008DFA4E3|nr:flagellin [Selenomonas ruminantium]
MAMVVKNNMSAVKTLGTLNKNSSALAKSLQKVSSGMKINSAADDASGYAISERMRVMVRSLDQADANTQNGVSLMKVAEGAVSSTVDILRTMKEKAINAANDSNTDADRAIIQKELDQSIDQIDDNANVTYNGKTLVDGSKMAKGDATKTSMTNQSLNRETTGSTRIIDLQNRNGEGLNILTTDTLTISYVIQGETYSFDVDIDETTTIDSALVDASGPYVRNNPMIRAAYAQYNSSRAEASSTYSSSYSAASSTYNETIHTASVNYNNITTNAVSAINSASNVMSTNYSTYNSWYLYASTEYANGAAWTQGYGSVDDIMHSLNGPSTALSNYSSASTIYNSTSTYYASVVNSASTVQASTIVSATAVRDSAYASALSTFNVAISNAASTLGASVGTFLPYKLSVDAGDAVGVAASGNTVYTANRENAITITSGAAGVQYQLSGITFSVKDSNGQIKKDVNAVLDNFSESVRAVNKSEDHALNLQVGAKANQSIRIGLTDMRSEALGLKSSMGTTLGVGTQAQANAAVNVLDNAIQKALNQQTDIGSIEARLEMTSANLVTSSENVQASESTLRDANMAKEMTEYTKNNILMQAAQAMLAQANQSSSNVLSLLQ